MSHFVAIKKIDGSQVALNLDRVVSVELIPSKGSPYYAVTDTNGRVHLLEKDPSKVDSKASRSNLKIDDKVWVWNKPGDTKVLKHFYDYKEEEEGTYCFKEGEEKTCTFRINYTLESVELLGESLKYPIQSKIIPNASLPIHNNSNIQQRCHIGTNRSNL